MLNALSAIYAGKKNINNRGGAPTTRGGTRPRGASEPSGPSEPRPAHSASTDTDTSSSADRDDGGAPKPKAPQKDATDAKKTEVTVLVVASGGIVADKHTDTGTLAYYHLTGAGFLVSNSCINLPDLSSAGKLSNTLNGDLKICVLVDLDSYNSSSDKETVLAGLIAEMHLVTKKYMLILQTKVSIDPTKAKAINQHAITMLVSNGIIEMGMRRALIVHDGNSGYATDVFNRAVLGDKAPYDLVAVNFNRGSGDSFDKTVTKIKSVIADREEPLPCMVIFQCERVNLFLVALHDVFKLDSYSTKVFSLGNSALLPTSYAYNLYEYHSTNTYVLSVGAAELSRVEHVPLDVAEHDNVAVISNAASTDLAPGKDPSGIYYYGHTRGAARYIMDKRKESGITSGFRIHEYRKDSEEFARINAGWLVFADGAVGLAVHDIETATSNIKVRYRLLVHPSVSKETTVTIRGKQIETGKIIQMDPSTVPLNASPQPAAQTNPVGSSHAKEPDASASAMPSRSSTGSSGFKAADTQKEKTLVVVNELDTAFTKSLDAYAKNKYGVSYKVITYAEYIKPGFVASLTQDMRLMFEAGDKKDSDLVYNALLSIATVHTVDSCPHLRMLYARGRNNGGLSSDLDLAELVPYHQYKHAYEDTFGGVQDGVYIYEVTMLSTIRKKTAIVVIPNAHKADPKIANRMVGKFQSKAPVAMLLTLVEVNEVRDGSKLANAAKTGYDTGLVYVLVADETDNSMDVLDAIHKETKYNLFVVQLGDKERVGRQDTRFSGWVRESAEAVGTGEYLSNPIPNTILKKATQDEMRTSIKTGRVGYVVTGSRDIDTLEALRDTHDKDGTLRKLICRGDTHAFRFYTALSDVSIGNLDPKGVLVILHESPLLDQSRVDALRKSKITVIVKQTKPSLKLIEQITNAGYKPGSGSSDRYIELESTQISFGMMSEFV